LAGVQCLDLSDNPIGAKGKKALAQAFGERVEL
jgi:hypothetical protein